MFKNVIYLVYKRFLKTILEIKGFKYNINYTIYKKVKNTILININGI